MMLPEISSMYTIYIELNLAVESADFITQQLIQSINFTVFSQK